MEKLAESMVILATQGIITPEELGTAVSAIMRPGISAFQMRIEKCNLCGRKIALLDCYVSKKSHPKIAATYSFKSGKFLK